MADETQNNQNIQADNNSIAFGRIDVGDNVGDIRIGHTIGYTSEQVSTLITQISTTFQPKPFDGRCPYKGLDVFEENDAEFFFGREKLVDELVARVKESRTVFITGPSGSGKSSLVRAGLIPALKMGAVKESRSDGWLYATLKPGRDPLEALASAFSRLKSPELGEYFLQNGSKPEVLHQCAESALSDRKNQRLVLFIDQFEEVFTQLSLDKTRLLIEMLAHAATVENRRVILLFAMRSDFVSNCATYPKLNELLNQQFIQIGAMQPEELVSAIAQPALRVGLRIDPDLIAQIINDMQGEPGALPLMQFALKDLFDAQHAKGGILALTLNDYLQRGGIRTALERHADDSFNRLDQHEQELARSIFGNLIEIGRGTQDTKRTAIFEELIPANANSDEIAEIVRKLADARLITTDEVAGKHTVTISHEKLIDAWSWLKKLVNENRDIIALQNEIADDAQEWEKNKRDASYLYAGARLATANEQLKSNNLVLSGTASEFIRVGQARKRRGRVIQVVSVSTIFVLLIAAVIIFASLTKQAQNQARIAQAGELSALALAEGEKHFDLALLLGLEGFNTFSNSRTRSTLFSVADSHPGLESFLFGHTSWVLSVAFSPDGKQLASGSSDKSIILWDVSDPAAPSQLATLSGHTSEISSVAFSPDGKLLASGSRDLSIILWDVSNPAAPSQLANLAGHSDSVLSVAFSPNGKQLASGSGDKSIILWDISNPAVPSQLATLSGHADIVNSVAFSPDGKQLASGSDDASILLWDISNPAAPSQGATLSGHTSWVLSVAFSPDGKQLASASSDASIRLWDVDRQTWIDRACQRVGRNFSMAEWVQYFPDVEYRKTCEQWPKHWSFYQATADEILSADHDANRVQKAIDRVRSEMELDSSIENPVEDSSAAVEKIVREKVLRAYSDNSKWQEAIELLQQALTSNLNIEIEYFNDACWHGSLWGYAAQALPLCEQAVAMDPLATYVHDSRGLARALTGNYQGAIEDFQFFVDEGPKQGQGQQDISKRQQWVVDLNAGKNPFTPELLEMLKHE